MSVPYNRVGHHPLESTAYEQIDVGSLVKGLSPTVYGASGLEPPKLAIVNVARTGVGVRFRADGTDPTSKLGTPVGPGGRIAVWGRRDISRVKFSMRESGLATLDVEYFA